MKYTPHKIIKRRARQLASAQGVALSTALEQLARKYGFADNHELAMVGKRHPDDVRLLKGAFNVSSLDEVIYLEPVYTNFLMLIDDEMSGAIAETNAEGFGVDDLNVIDTDYDVASGLLTLTLSFEYSGDQMLDKPWCGNAFYILEALLRLCWRGDGWEFSYNDMFEVLQSDTDRDRDYSQQLADGLI